MTPTSSSCSVENPTDTSTESFSQLENVIVPPPCDNGKKTPGSPANNNESSHLHCVLVVNTTASMEVYLPDLKEALRQVSALLMILFPISVDVSLLSYEDYGCDSRLLLRKVVQGTYRELAAFCSSLEPHAPAGKNNEDSAEASKTALNSVAEMIQVWRKNNNNDAVVVFHYTDAPPHHKLTNPSEGCNRRKEQLALADKEPGFDWCEITRCFRKHNNIDDFKLFSIVPETSPASRCGAAFYALLGELIVIPRGSTAQYVTQTTMMILMQLLGQEAMMPTEGSQRVVFQRHDQVMERLMSGEFDEDSFPELNTKFSKISVRAKNTADLAWLDDFAFNAMPAFAAKIDLLSRLETEFKTNPSLRERVFQVMNDLIQPQRVMALTTNSTIFGRLWRLECQNRDDVRVAGLISRMGGCASSKLLSSEDQAKLKIWIEDSYNFADEINEKIRSHLAAAHVYVLDTFAKDNVPSIYGLRSLARAPSSSALANLQKILSHVSLVKVKVVDDLLPVDDEGNCRYIPETMSDFELFTMFPHLIQAGTKFSHKPAALLAILCCRSPNSLLEERARRFLISIKGKWLPPVERIDRAEVISYEFSSLIASCTVVEGFTDEERAFFVRLHDIWRYRRGRFTDFEVTTHFSPNKPTLLPDRKKICRTCLQWTSTTLLDSSSQECGVCRWMQENSDNCWTRPKNDEQYFVEENKSYIVECTVCTTLYAVLGVGNLNIAPKCRYCRGLEKGRPRNHGAPFRRCGCCKAKWCDPSSLSDAASDAGAFLCAVCEAAGATEGSSCVPKASQTTHIVSLQSIIDENPEAVVELGFRKEAANVIFSETKISDAVVSARSILFLPPQADTAFTSIKVKGKFVLNQSSLLKDVQARIASSTFVDTCHLCFEDMAVEKLRMACGNCPNRCCQECLTDWYGQNQPGKLFILCHDLCPFCRQRPKYNVMIQYNHQACGIIGHSRRNGAELRLQPEGHYAWCSQCWKLQPCSEGYPQLKDFVCEECEEKKQELTDELLADAKPCPGCHTLTTHLGGCSHMSCQNCGCHWCWQCGVFKADNAKEVYNHMWVVHNGWQNEAR